MEKKTIVHAPEGKQEIIITREFDLPVDLLFRAHAEPELISQWMGTRIIKFEAKKHGSYQIETPGPTGDIAFRANGVFHDFITDKKIIRSFEMEGSPFSVQLDFFDFEAVSADSSRLTMHMIFKSVEHRDELLKMPFQFGLNMAHNRLQEIVSQLK